MRQSLILLQFNECLGFGGFFCGKAELCAENALREGSAGYIFSQHDVNKVLCQVFITAAVGARGLHRDVIHPIGHVVDVGDAFGVEIKFHRALVSDEAGAPFPCGLTCHKVLGVNHVQAVGILHQDCAAALAARVHGKAHFAGG